MMNCGQTGNIWVQHALDCLPDELFSEWPNKLAFVSMKESDGRRLTRAFCEGHDVIILSERIVPKQGTNEGSPEVRYFYFVVLHEVAHAICQHRPLNEISQKDNDSQEAEANKLAFQWFNEYLEERNSPHFPAFTEAELKQAQDVSQAAMRAAL